MFGVFFGVALGVVGTLLNKSFWGMRNQKKPSMTTKYMEKLIGTKWLETLLKPMELLSKS